MPSSRCFNGARRRRLVTLALALACTPIAPAAAQGLRGYERDLAQTIMEMRSRRESNSRASRFESTISAIMSKYNRETSSPRQVSQPMRNTASSSAPVQQRTMTPGEMLVHVRGLADKGDVASRVRVGHMYATNYLGAPNYAAAYQAYSAAAAQGSAEGQAYKGVFLMLGNGVARDSLAAMTQLRQAASKGEPTALEWLSAYAPDEMTPAQRVAFFQKSAASGDPIGMEWMGALYERGDGVPKNDSLSFMWYKRAADAGNQRAQLEIGNRYVTGTGGTAKDLVKAREVYTTLANNGNAKAMMRLAYELIRGVDGVPADTAAAMRLFMRAAAAGEGRAAYEVGTAYRTGSAAIPRDLTKARAQFVLGDSLGYNLASYNLGVASILGEATRPDTLEAARLFERALNEGYVSAGMDLGEFYESGFGPIRVDAAKARAFYTKAALTATTPRDVAAARKKVIALGGDAAAIDAAIAGAAEARTKP